MLERTLFQMPAPRDIKPTPTQLETLDLVAMYEALPLPAYVSREALRNLIRAGLVQVLSVGPSHYCLTPVGRLVRGRSR